MQRGRGEATATAPPAGWRWNCRVKGGGGGAKKFILYQWSLGDIKRLFNVNKTAPAPAWPLVSRFLSPRRVVVKINFRIRCFVLGFFWFFFYLPGPQSRAAAPRGFFCCRGREGVCSGVWRVLHLLQPCVFLKFFFLGFSSHSSFP